MCQHSQDFSTSEKSEYIALKTGIFLWETFFCNKLRVSIKIEKGVREKQEKTIVTGRLVRNSAETAFPQNLHTRKLGEITIFYKVPVMIVWFEDVTNSYSLGKANFIRCKPISKNRMQG